jgi:hypothetical protein
MTREQNPDKGKEEQMGNNPSDTGTNRQQQQNQGGKQQQGSSGTQPVSNSVNSEHGHARVTPGGGQGAQHSQSARGAGQFGDDQGGAETAQSLMEQSQAGAQGDRHQGDDRGLPGQQQQSSQQGTSQSRQAQQSQQQGSSQSGQSSQQPQQQNLQETVRQAQQQKSAQQEGGGAAQQHQQAAGGTLQPGSKGPQNPAVSGSHQTLQPHSSGHDQPGKSAGRTNSNDDSANGPHRGG